MDKFGKIPFRAKKSFGVAGLLAEGCPVFYSSLFTTRNIGRVADLVCAKLVLGGVGLDELRLRALLLFTFFEAYRAGTRDPNSQAPMNLECGFDPEKIAVGISFVPSEKNPVRAEGLAERIAAGEPRDRFEALLAQIHDEADRTLLRFEKSSGKIEVVALLGIPGRIDRAEIDDRGDVAVIQVDTAADGETESKDAVASQYVELGDLNYAELLKEDGPNRATPAFTGEILAHGCTELEDAIRVRGRSGESVDSSVVRISGVTQRISNDDAIRIKGSGEKVQDESEVVVSGGPNEYEKRIAELEARIAELESGDEAEHDEELAEDETESSGPSGKSIKRLFKSVWPFKRGAGDEEGNEGTDGEPGADAADHSTEGAANEAPKDEAPKEEKEARTEDAATEEAAAATAKPESGAESDKPGAEAAANSLVAEIEAGSLDRTIIKAQKESADLKRELGTSRAKRWVDGLMSELVSEKARLHEFAKKLNQTIRQKELEFRNRERTLEEELRRRDDMLRQKNNALIRAKEQASQMQITVERLKSATENAQDEAHFKQKYQLTQKILAQAKDENMQLQKKLDDLRAQLATQQITKGKGTVTDTTVLQKSERLQRQVDEFKKANQQLMEKLTEVQKKGSGSANVEELKRRLELAAKVGSVHQREAEQLRLRVEELQREELRLKSELAKTYAELKATRASRPGGGGSKAA